MLSQQQTQRVMNRFNQCKTNLEKYVYLTELQDRNETIFYKILMENIEQMGMALVFDVCWRGHSNHNVSAARIIYTPTVGEACLKFGMFQESCPPL
jgi:malate dehydrogenase (oxaloacetate-decarboxylating)(NADP+)